MPEPVSAALQFGFLAVLYLFLLWVARSALRDLRRTGRERASAAGARWWSPAASACPSGRAAR